ncbi:phosphatase phospho-type [Jimgerdemannia flammicorona]|uniref:Phosphatase phospho-type n=1 Tax=Jimgerdemannia flammicorona TaxID=994334 RepID=A0A433QGT5_9FUNG|nr:phosphatase phospho-type [Jimgerdemannia flammicorona]
MRRLPKTLVVFDFDWSMIDVDSDHFIFEKLAKDLREKMDIMENNMVWTDMVNALLSELPARGITRSDIDQVLTQIPFRPAMVRALHLAHSAGADLRILSDANTYTISRILDNHGVRHLFTEVATNRGYWDHNDRLWVERYLRLDVDAPHECKTVNGKTGRRSCAPNLCKGKELRRMMNQNKYERVVFIGDGANDFCPSCQLSSNDVVLCRAGRVLETILTQPRHAAQVKAQVIFWNFASDILQAFENLFQSVESDDSVVALDRGIVLSTLDAVSVTTC